MIRRGSSSTLVLIALLAGCTSAGPMTRPAEPSAALTTGMTRNDVRTRLGEPRRVVTTTGGERWTYADGTVHERPEHAIVTTLTFEGERLAAVEAFGGD